MLDEKPLKQNILTVTELTRNIKNQLEKNFNDVKVTGEISNYTFSASQHAYFSIKDENAVIKVCLFKQSYQKIKFKLEDGLKVVIFGSISVYEKRGDYQLIAYHVEPEGIGALQLAFNQLKKKLEQEGLFSPKNKKPIPPYPSSIGVVTSSTGAALRDILEVSKKRFTSIPIYIYPALVQGENAAPEIARAISIANKLNDVDVLIVGRGGGAYEDLWAFNEEPVARAIFESKIPIVSAVGHEVDFTIADYVADLRAPTPSAAAAIVIPSREEIYNLLNLFSTRMHNYISSKVKLFRERLLTYSEENITRIFNNCLNNYKISLDDISKSLIHALERLTINWKNRFDILNEKLQVLNPTAILKRGYSIVYKKIDNTRIVIKSDKQLKVNDEVEIILGEGNVKANILK